jgi:hypothetical protein
MKAIRQRRYGPPDVLELVDVDPPQVDDDIHSSRRSRPRDLVVLKELIDTGVVTPVVDRTYPMQEIAAAAGYLEQGHARGKVVITV